MLRSWRTNRSGKLASCLLDGQAMRLMNFLLVHCIEQIRQCIMCSGDMTPIPTKFNPLRKHSYVDSDVKHTCRNFGVLRDWLSARYNGSLAVQPVCPGATKPEEGSISCVIDE